MLSTKTLDTRLSEKLPFVVGITGHRDIRCLENSSGSSLDSIKQEIKKALQYWFERLERNTPLWLLSGMAEGTDLLAIIAAEEIVKELCLSDGAIKIIPCLPMDEDSFAQDFDIVSTDTKFGIDGFREILSRYKENHLIIKNELSIDDYERAIGKHQYGKERGALYLNVGAFIAKYSNVLIALWDGKEAEGVGGTAEVVFLTAGSSIEWPENTENRALKQLSDFDGQQGGVIHHIPVSRAKNNPQPKCLNRLSKFTGFSLNSPHELYISAKPENTYPKSAQLLEKPSEDKKYLLQEFLSNEFEMLITQLKEHNKNIAFNSDPLQIYSAGLNVTFGIFKRADECAVRYQTKYRRATLLFFAIAVVGLVSYELISNFIGKSIGILFSSTTIIAVAISILTIYVLKIVKLKYKYQLFRSVAEGMRVRGFLNLGDVAPESKPILPRRYRHRFPIINHAIAIAEIDWWSSSAIANLQKVKKEWIESQLEFLNQRLSLENNQWKGWNSVFKRPNLANSILNIWAKRTFGITVFFGVILVFVQLFDSLDNAFYSVFIQQFLMLHIQFFLLLSGALALWREISNYEAIATGYNDLRLLYERANILIDQDNGDKTKKMLMELAREAIQEHAEWNDSENKSDLSLR